MQITKSLRISSVLYDELEELAVRRNMAPSALMRDIVTEYLGHKSGGVADVNDLVQFNISLSIKLLYMVRYISDNIDKDTTSDVIAEAEEFIKRNGLDGSQTQREADHG